MALPLPHLPHKFSDGDSARIRLPKCNLQGAESQAAARLAGAFTCPSCGQPWSHDQRMAANQHCRLVHEGQAIDAEGVVDGPLPSTDTLGFRWSAVNNLFLTAGDFAADEWRASRSYDEENAEREMRQFVWCVPVAPTKWSQTALETSQLAARMIDVPRGVVPSTAKWLTAAIDLGKYLAHWIVVAWSEHAIGHILDYGRIEVASEDLGVEQALMATLRQFRDLAKEGWPVSTADGERMQPGQVWSVTNAFTFTNRYFESRFVGRTLGFHTNELPMPGCHATPFQGHLLRAARRETTFAPSYHFVADLGTQEAWSNLPGGPSESWLTRWYKNDIRLWCEGQYKKLSAQ